MTSLDRGSNALYGIKKLLAPGCSVAGDIDADPSAPNQKNYSEYAKPVLNSPNLPLAGDTLITEGILIFEMLCLGYQVNFM